MAALKKHLDAITAEGCAIPDCQHDHTTLFFRAKCHADAPLDVSYTHGSGVLRISCRACRQDIVNVKVATE